MRVGLVGNGRWGKKIKEKLIELGHSVQIVKRKQPLLKKLSECNLVFIATPDNTHYKILNKIAILEKTTFCEKPLSRKLKDIKIFKYFKKNKLYISDISNFYPNINLKEKNFFIRKKFESTKKVILAKRYDLLYRFAFHDFAYIYKKLGPINFRKVEIIKSKKNLEFSLIKKKSRHFREHFNNFQIVSIIFKKVSLIFMNFLSFS